MVDQRLDHIESGTVRLDRGPGVLAAAVGDLHPVAPDAADGPVPHADVASPSSSGTSDRPWVRCSTRHAEDVGEGGEEVDVGGEGVDGARR